MTFNEFSKKGEDWAIGEKFHIVHRNETERKLVFQHEINEDVSFYIVCPENTSVKWHVWSDSEDVLMHLNDAIQALESCQEKTINEVLQLVSKHLQSVIQQDFKDNKVDLSELEINYNDQRVDKFGIFKIELEVKLKRLRLKVKGATKDDSSDDGYGDDDDDDDNDDDDEIDDMYYHDEDADAIEDTTTKIPDDDKEDDKFYSGDGSPAAVGRLVKDMKALKKSNGQFGVTGCPRGDNLFVWDVKLTDFDKKSHLGKDLIDYAQRYKREPVIYMELKFPKDYPMSPPFARVLRPRFRFLTGHITIGGSVCMEMLTRSGWRPINDIESILVQIRSEVISDPNARLDSTNPDREYDETEAKQAFERTVQRYGWSS